MDFSRTEFNALIISCEGPFETEQIEQYASCITVEQHKGPVNCLTVSPRPHRAHSGMANPCVGGNLNSAYMDAPCCQGARLSE